MLQWAEAALLTRPRSERFTDLSLTVAVQHGVYSVPIQIDTVKPN
jgi:hypothetical protein